MTHILEIISEYERNHPFEGKPNRLYQAKNYLVSLGGKRARPAALLASCLAFGGSIEEAIKAAWSFELFHNFTLAHDDIMDDAPLRRGKVALHEKYDVPTSILAGDNIMLYVYKNLFEYPQDIALEISKLVTQTGIEICEGQYMDMSFEEMSTIKEEQYIEMIRLKTSVLLAACLKAGAAIAKAPKNIQKEMYDLGVHLGIGFQIKDDLFDYGYGQDIGKPTGIDIKEKKTTLPLIYALNKVGWLKKRQLINIVKNHNTNRKKVDELFAFVKEQGGIDYAEKVMLDYTQKAKDILMTMPENNARASLLRLVDYTITRKK